MNTKTEEKKEIALRKQARRKLLGQETSIARGRSFNRACVGWNTPVQIVEGNKSPTLEGQPYLKTHFNRNGFHKTLYTPSTMCVVVGKEWSE